MLNNILQTSMNWIVKYGFKIIIAVIILYIGWKIINHFSKKLPAIFKYDKEDEILRRFLESFLAIAFKVILIVVLLEFIGVETTWFAAFIASIGLAIGLAFKNSLSNFASGIVILIVRPFSIGDIVKVAGYIGKVKEINIFYTHLTAEDDKEVLIPNNTLSNSSLIKTITEREEVKKQILK
ncbi:mechanosensitive ion channel family protein [Clostridium tarantellae]|uniref:Mechanosensitive ion channel n=1 Tax=Clostridium tarantellae TaxID=39493 RepID=A0A6I1MP55_9CLOT|nr:mechanosensitive ion channel domain-containing protein [Clostridium tarantellae]MPQ45205.1 mechanosensitive ion channel [Clostridium tarantellae]